MAAEFSAAVARGLIDGAVPSQPQVAVSAAESNVKEKRSEQEQRLQEAIADLEPHYRDVLARRGEGLSWDEVGAALGLPSAGAARMLHARARVALMKVMSDREDDGAAE